MTVSTHLFAQCIPSSVVLTGGFSSFSSANPTGTATITSQSAIGSNPYYLKSITFGQVTGDLKLEIAQAFKTSVSLTLSSPSGKTFSFDEDEADVLLVTTASTGGTVEITNIEWYIPTCIDNTTPVIAATQIFSIDENADNGTVIGTVAASDADDDDLSNWMITDGNDDGIFAIDSETGELTVSDNTSLDFETSSSHTLTVTVSDGTATSASETVTVDVNDLDEIAPIISVDDLITSDPSPALSGTIDDHTATISITVAGQTLAAANNGDGTWTLADDALSILVEGSYTISATATDDNDNTSNMVTATLTVDLTPPTVESITLVDNPSSISDLIYYDIAFSEAIKNASILDFTVNTIAGSGAGIVNSISADTGRVIRVEVGIVGTLNTNQGELRLDFIGEVEDLTGNIFTGTAQGEVFLTEKRYEGASPTRLMLKPGDVPAQIPFKLNTGSLGLLFPGLITFYGSSQPVQMEVEMDNRIDHLQGFMTDDNAEIGYTASFSVLNPTTNQYEFAVRVSGVCIAGTDHNYELDSLEKRFATVRFISMNVDQSEVGNINTTSMLFRLNLTASGFVAGFNSIVTNWYYLLDCAEPFTGLLDFPFSVNASGRNFGNSGYNFGNLNPPGLRREDNTDNFYLQAQDGNSFSIASCNGDEFQLKAVDVAYDENQSDLTFKGYKNGDLRGEHLFESVFGNGSWSSLNLSRIDIFAEVDSVLIESDRALSEFFIDNILFGEPIAPKISINNPSVDESTVGNVTLSYTVSLSEPAPDGGVTVNYTTSDGTATSGLDYTALSGTVTFEAGEVAKPIEVTVLGESIVESNETIILELTDPVGFNIAIEDSEGIGVITNEDQASVTIADVTVNEDDGTAAVVLILDNSVDGGFNVAVSTIDGTATIADADYEAINSVVKSFSGTADESETVVVTIGNDTKFENDETLTISMDNLVPAKVASGAIDITDEATVTINNDDTEPTVTLSVDESSIVENGGEATLTATLSNLSINPVTVSLSYSGTAVRGTDYDGNASNMITVEAGQLSGDAIVIITSIDDGNPETNETIVVEVTGVSNGSEDGEQRQTISILDDDTPGVAFATTSSSGGEDQLSTELQVDMTVESALKVEVAYTLTGTATGGGTDYTLADGILTFDPGSTSETITIADIVDDAILEANETVIVTLSEPINANLGTNTVHTYTINDNDRASITIDNITIEEDADEILIPVVLDNAVQGGFIVEVSTADGTALEADMDYTPLVNEMLTFIGDAAEIQTIALTGSADNKVEPDENLTVSLSNLSTTLPVGITDDATITLTNDDAAAIILSSAAGDEDDGSITISARLNNPVQDEDGFSVVLSTSDGTAQTSDNDYNARTQTFNFSGEGGQSFGFTVSIEEDSKLETNETIRVTQSGLTGNALPVSIASLGIITIRNDDEASVTIEDVSANEDDGPITLTAILDNEVEGGFEVDVVSIDGTATTMDGDYSALSAQTLVFDGTAGEQVNFELVPTSDNIVEPTETLTISLVNLDETNLDVGIEDQALITLVNDDSAKVSITATTEALEDDTNGAFTIRTDKPIEQDVTLSISIEGDAIPEMDYGTLSPEYVLPRRTTELIIPVNVLADDLVEPDEVVTVSLDTIEVASVSRAVASVASVVIRDDDHLPVITPNQAFSIDEDAPDGAAVGGVVATDEDTGTSFGRWSILSGNDDGVFTLDATSGTLTVANSALLDFELRSEYVLTISVSDGTNTSEPETIAVEVTDASVPTLVLSTEVGEITNQSTISFTIVSSEMVTGLLATDIVITNGLVSDFVTVDELTYTFAVVPQDDGMVQLSIAEGAAEDAAGNTNPVSNEVMFFYDGTVPTATLMSTAVPLSNESSATVQIDFPELVSGLENDDFDLTANAQITSLTGSEAAYMLDLTLTEGEVEVVLKESAVMDQAGNVNPSAVISWEVDLTTTEVIDVTVEAEAVNTLNEESLDIIIDAGTEGTFTYAVTAMDGSAIQGTGELIDGEAVISDLNVSALPDGPLNISLTVTDEAGNVSDPVNSTIIKNTKEQIPQGFSPNGDGTGDMWVIPGVEDNPNNIVTIFNRYGTKVWEIEGYDNQNRAWDSQSNVDGIFGSSALPDGTYFYVITFPGSTDPTISGFVILKR